MFAAIVGGLVVRDGVQPCKELLLRLMDGDTRDLQADQIALSITGHGEVGVVDVEDPALRIEAEIPLPHRLYDEREAGAGRLCHGFLVPCAYSDDQGDAQYRKETDVNQTFHTV